MLADVAREIAAADTTGRLEPARSATGTVTHVRITGTRRALCGTRMARSGDGTRSCRQCDTMLAAARAAAGR